MVSIQGAFLGLTMAVIAFTVFYSVTSPYYATHAIADESHTYIEQNVNFGLSNYPILAATDSLSAVNATDGTDFGTLTLNSNYTLSYTLGTVNISSLGSVPSSYELNVTADYTYTGTEYMTNSMARSMVSYLPVFGSIALLVAVAALL